MKNMLEDPRDQNLVVSLLQDSLDADVVKTTAMIDFLWRVEPEAEISVKRIKTVIHAGQSTTISCKCQVEVVEKKTSLLFTADPLHIPEGLSIADTVVVAKKSSKQLLSDTTH